MSWIVGIIWIILLIVSIINGFFWWFILGTVILSFLGGFYSEVYK